MRTIGILSTVILLGACSSLSGTMTTYNCPDYDGAVDCRSPSDRTLARTLLVVDDITLGGIRPKSSAGEPKVTASHCSNVCGAPVVEIACVEPTLPACSCGDSLTA